MPPRNKKNEVDMTQNDLLARIDERLKSLQETQNKTFAQVQATNGRVTSLERWRSYLIGGGVVILTIVGWLVSVIK